MFVGVCLLLCTLVLSDAVCESLAQVVQICSFNFIAYSMASALVDIPHASQPLAATHVVRSHVSNELHSEHFPLPRTSLSLEEWSYRYIYIYIYILCFCVWFTPNFYVRLNGTPRIKVQLGLSNYTYKTTLRVIRRFRGRGGFSLLELV